jgi:hypothetical protein
LFLLYLFVCLVFFDLFVLVFVLVDLFVFLLLLAALCLILWLCSLFLLGMLILLRIQGCGNSQEYSQCCCADNCD